MSAPLTPDAIKFRQRLLSSAGFYKGKIDGIWGPKTDAANIEWEVDFLRTRSHYGKFDLRTERNTETLLPVAQRLARLVLSHLVDSSTEARILSGTRTYAEQDALYRQGRFGNKQPRVTNAKGGQSNHNFGIAWDIGIFKGGKYITAVIPYQRAGKLVMEKFSDELEWGGNWQMKDFPHYQVRTGMKLSEVRTRFEAGKLTL